MHSRPITSFRGLAERMDVFLEMTLQYPDWIQEGGMAVQLLRWLREPGYKADTFSGHLLMKCRTGKNILLYALSLPDDSRRWEKTVLCAVLHLPELSLYEVKPVFYQAAGIPREFVFPDRWELLPELERQVSASVQTAIRKDWDGLLHKYGCATRGLIPQVSREQVQAEARRYVRMGKRPAEIVYQPRCSFTKLGWNFSDGLFLQYLDAPRETAEMLAGRLLRDSLEEISQKKIYYGCIREEMEEIQKTQDRTEKAKNGSEGVKPALRSA